MDPKTEERIRARAYAIWQEEGCPDGRHDTHWARAEHDVRTAGPSSVAEPGTVAVPAASPGEPPAVGEGPAKTKTRTVRKAAAPRKAKVVAVEAPPAESGGGSTRKRGTRKTSVGA